MNERVEEITIRSLFELTAGDDALGRVRQLAAVEVSGVEAPDVGKAVRALESVPRRQVAAAVEKMRDFDALQVLAQGWSRARKIQKAIAASVAAPSTPKSAALSEHVIESVHKPRLVLSIAGSDWCQVEFRIVLSVTLESAELELLGGRLTGVRLGPATGKMKMECKDVELKEFHHDFRLLPEYRLKSPLDLAAFAAPVAPLPP